MINRMNMRVTFCALLISTFVAYSGNSNSVKDRDIYAKDAAGPSPNKQPNKQMSNRLMELQDRQRGAKAANSAKQ